MDIITLDQFKSLTKKRNNPSISIYMPTFRKGSESEQNAIRYKNQLRDAEKRLTDLKIKKTEIENILNPAKLLPDDTDFWNYQSDGLAVFISPGEFFYYRIPETFDENIYVSDRYYLRPLLPTISNNKRYLILTLNQKNIRLFESTPYNINEIKLKDVPVSIDEFLAMEEEDRSLQFHTSAPHRVAGGNRTTKGEGSAIFHGHGGGSDDATYKEKIHQFFNLVESGLQKYLNNEKAPLLLAGLDYLIPMYKGVNSYENILEKTLLINTQELREDELRDAAWEVVKTSFDKQAEEALNKYSNYVNTVKASDKIDEIVRASFTNRILYLFIDPAQQIWGKFNPDTHRVEIHYNNYEAQDIDLLDLAAEQTLSHNGIVFFIAAERIPGNKPAAALYRY